MCIIIYSCFHFLSHVPRISYTYFAVCLLWFSLVFFRWQIHANCRLRRIYFADKLYTEDEIPHEFKLYLPIKAAAEDEPVPAVQAAPGAAVEETAL